MALNRQLECLQAAVIVDVKVPYHRRIILFLCRVPQLTIAEAVVVEKATAVREFGTLSPISLLSLKIGTGRRFLDTPDTRPVY